MIWILAIAAGLVYGQDDLAKAAGSPYEIQKYVDSHENIDWGPLWDALHTKDVFLPPCQKRRFFQDCVCQLIEVKNPPQVIVRLYHLESWFEVYLRFIPKASGGWIFEGDYTPLVKYFQPSHDILRFGGKPFLLVTGQGDSGSGLSTEYQAWMDLSGLGFKQVFGFTPRGHLSLLGVGISREVTATVVSLEAQPVERIHVARTVTFSFDGEDNKLFLGSRTSHSAYSRASDGRFKFDPAFSDTPEKEVKDLYEDFDPGLSDEDFLKYDLEQLRKFATGPEGAEKRWLREFLAECKNTPEKRALEALLKR